MYEINFDSVVIDELTKLEKPLKKRIFDKIISTKENPHRYYIRLKGRTDYKLRVGDYRIISDIDDDKKTIQVTLIGHRKNIYKRLQGHKNSILSNIGLKRSCDRREQFGKMPS